MLSVEHLTKTFPRQRGDAGEPIVAASDVSFEVPEGKLFTILGPSGCGKTTTLRCIAGLETPDSGEIRLDDRVFFSSATGKSLRPNERRVGMIFQSYAIWPHLTVFDNVAFPLVVKARNRRQSKREIKERVQEALAVVQLGSLADRRATDLSGGQQQRVALARALIMEPPLLLLDEPLSNLDAKLRAEMRLELKRIQRQLRVTAVLVTHDQGEALAMSNLVAVMQDGVIKQIGPPRDIYERPSSRFVADFIGSTNFLEGIVESKEAGGVYLVTTRDGRLRVGSDNEYLVGAAVVVSIRPEQVQLEAGRPQLEGPNRWGGLVVMRGFLGESVDHLVNVGSTQIRAHTHPSRSISRGLEVTVVLPEEGCALIPPD
ncbi:MAG: iron(III) transport system ATP-binding protein [Actinomycetota bacterium]|nr:iron(III) transport system ATP-binding protein [Actinomycetota bacterium]